MKSAPQFPARDALAIHATITLVACCGVASPSPVTGKLSSSRFRSRRNFGPQHTAIFRAVCISFIVYVLRSFFTIGYPKFHRKLKRGQFIRCQRQWPQCLILCFFAYGTLIILEEIIAHSNFISMRVAMFLFLISHASITPRHPTSEPINSGNTLAP